MGNRAAIVTEKRDLALYLHWNGGRDSVEAFLEYCALRGLRSPESDEYGWARLAQVVCNFFGADGLSCGIYEYEKDCEPQWDNGDYIIRDWKIVDRRYPYEGFAEQASYDLTDMLYAIDRAQPASQQLGTYLESEVIPASKVHIGDMAYLDVIGGVPKPFAVVGFAQCPGHFGNGAMMPYVERYGENGSYEKNPNNFLRAKTVRIIPRR